MPLKQLPPTKQRKFFPPIKGRAPTGPVKGTPLHDERYRGVPSKTLPGVSGPGPTGVRNKPGFEGPIPEVKRRPGLHPNNPATTPVISGSPEAKAKMEAANKRLADRKKSIAGKKSKADSLKAAAERKMKSLKGSKKPNKPPVGGWHGTNPKSKGKDLEANKREAIRRRLSGAQGLNARRRKKGLLAKKRLQESSKG